MSYEEYHGDDGDSKYWKPVSSDKFFVFLIVIITLAMVVCFSSYYGNRGSTETAIPVSTTIARPTARPTERPTRNSNPRPANCTEAIEMGLSERQAGNWSHLDRDGDGKACYGD